MSRRERSGRRAERREVEEWDRDDEKRKTNVGGDQAESEQRSP